MRPKRATRPLRADDAQALVELVVRNREEFAPWEPAREASHYTVAGQRAAVLRLLERHDFGITVPHAILDGHGDVAGRITLDGISRGAFQSCTVGYWVSGTHATQGLATAALSEMCAVAFEELGLHRIEAGTLLHNSRSQRVLNNNRFIRYGEAPQFVKIAGRWQNHLLFQRINEEG